MKSKLKNPICIAIVITAIVLAIILTGITVFVLPGLSDEAVGNDKSFNLGNLFDVGNLGSGIGGGGSGALDLSGNIGMDPGGGGGSGGSSLAYEVYASKSENVYLKVKSFGDYTGRSWSEANVYTEYFSVYDDGAQYSANYLTGLLMSMQDSSSAYIEIKPHIAQYAIPYYIGIDISNYDIQLNDVVTEGKPPERYSMYHYYSDDLESLKTYSANKISELKNARAFEREYRFFVRDNYLYVDDETRDFMWKKIHEVGIKGDTHEIIEQVAEYISSVAVYDLKYDRNLDSEENIAIAFLDKYKTGICQHYATAATLLFRTLGIPARYTIGYAATSKKDDWAVVTSNDAHAWVEVYIDGIGWTYVEVTGSSVIQPPPKDDIYEVTLKPANEEKIYDGTPLEPSGRLVGFEEFEAMNYSYKVKIEGIQTGLGKSYSNIVELTIYDPDGNVATDQFKCTQLPGTLHIYRREITFVSNSAEIVYDGTEHTNDELSCYLDSGELEAGHSYKVTPTASCTNVGYVTSSFDVDIIDLGTGDIITDEYKIVKNFGRLKVLPRSITFKAGDAQKVYDGTPLTSKKIEITDGSFAPGHRRNGYQINGTQTEIGRSDNIIDINSIVIVDARGNNVTENYEIHTEKGTLRVTYK